MEKSNDKQQIKISLLHSDGISGDFVRDQHKLSGSCRGGREESGAGDKWGGKYQPLGGGGEPSAPREDTLRETAAGPQTS